MARSSHRVRERRRAGREARDPLVSEPDEIENPAEAPPVSAEAPPVSAEALPFNAVAAQETPPPRPRRIIHADPPVDPGTAPAIVVPTDEPPSNEPPTDEPPTDEPPSNEPAPTPKRSPRRSRKPA